jgi:hypothetical protein
VVPPAPSLQDVIHQVESDAGEDEPLVRLRTASTVVREMSEVGDAALGYFVDQARRSGHSWSEIGEALGVSKQAAQQKHTLRISFGPNSPSFERFTPRARNVVAGAEAVAREWGHDSIETEHLLLALYDEPGGIAAVVLEKLGFPYDRAEAAIEARAERGKNAPQGKLTFTPRCRAVFVEALTCALELGHNYIGTEHLLLGLSRSEGVAAEVLSESGFDRDAVSAAVTESLTGLSSGSRGGTRTRKKTTKTAKDPPRRKATSSTRTRASR